LVEGVTLYKKFGKDSMSGKIFKPSQAEFTPPESCGYATRNIRINLVEEVLEIKNPKSKHVENKISLVNLKGLLLGGESKSIVKAIKMKNAKPNGEINKLVRNDFIQFNLLVKDGNYDFISPNYLTFKAIEGALNEIINNRRNLKEILNHLDSK